MATVFACLRGFLFVDRILYVKLQDGQPNDRMIGKLCEYASKNPMRIPKVHPVFIVVPLHVALN